MPTNPVFAVILGDIFSLAFKTIVKGPGQNLSVNYWNKSLVSLSISTKSKALYIFVIWTITGSDNGRSK